MTNILKVDRLSKRFPVRSAASGSSNMVYAVNDVSFTIAHGETLGLVGESGCGKSTIGKMVVRLLEPSDGQIILDGNDITHASYSTMRPLRKNIQMIFQDPYGSLNPRQKAGDIVGEPLLVHGMKNKAQRSERVAELFQRVGLRPDQMKNVPSNFSGGQRQRLAIARALALNPSLIVADEPVSALDVSIQAQVINLMSDIQRELGLAYLFVAHDLGVVQHISNRVAVMYLGRIVEIGTTSAIFSDPRHPYTIALMEAAPRITPDLKNDNKNLSRGELPSPLNPPKGCVFHPRCSAATSVCKTERPILSLKRSGSQAACHNMD